MYTYCVCLNSVSSSQPCLRNRLISHGQTHLHASSLSMFQLWVLAITVYNQSIINWLIYMCKLVWLCETTVITSNDCCSAIILLLAMDIIHHKIKMATVQLYHGSIEHFQCCDKQGKSREKHWQDFKIILWHVRDTFCANREFLGCFSVNNVRIVI